MPEERSRRLSNRGSRSRASAPELREDVHGSALRDLLGMPLAALLTALGLGLPAEPARSTPERVQLRCPAGGQLNRSWTRAESYVYTCTSGAEPWLVRPDVWAADQLAVYKLVPGESEPQLVLRAEKHQRPVEYWVDGNQLIVVHHTRDPREKFPVPFARQTVAIEGEACDAKVELMLEPESPDPLRIAQLITRLGLPAARRTTPDDVAELLFELRNQGLTDPRAMAAKLEAVRLSGEAARAHAQVMSELALAALALP